MKDKIIRHYEARIKYQSEKLKEAERQLELAEGRHCNNFWETVVKERKYYVSDLQKQLVYIKENLK